MSVRRIFVILFSFVFGVSLISAPMVAAAPAVDSPLMDEGPLDQTGSETFIAFRLPETLQGQFDKRAVLNMAFNPLVPLLQDALTTQRLQNFQVDEESFGIRLTGADPTLLAQLSRQPGIERIVDLSAQANAQPEAPLAERRLTVQDLLQTSPLRDAPMPTAPVPDSQAARLPAAGNIYPNLTPGHFSVNMPWNYIWGYTTLPSLPVVVNVRSGATLLAYGATSSDSNGYYNIYVYTGTGQYYYTKPGDTIEIVETGGSTYSWVLPAFTARMSFANTTITGTAQANAPLYLNIFMTDGDIWQELTAGADGAYQFTFPGKTFRRNSGNSIYMYDPVSQNQILRALYIGPQVWLNEYWTCTDVGSVGFASQTATFNLLSSTRSLEETQNVSMDHIGWACVHFNNAPILPGKFFQLVTPAGDILEVSVPVLNGSVDTATDLVTGSAPPSSSLVVEVYSQTDYQWYYLYPTSTAGGTYTADFGSDGVDIQTNDYGYTHYWDTLNDHIRYRYAPPFFSVYGSGYYSRIEGNLNIANVLLTINLKQANGTLRGSWQTITDSGGGFSQYFYDPVTYYFTQPQPGDLIEVIPQGGPTSSLTYPLLTTLPDYNAGTISGSAVPDSRVTITVSRQSLTGEASSDRAADASPVGSYVVDYSGGGVQPGDQVSIKDTLANGNSFYQSRYLPNRLFVDTFQRQAYVLTSAGIPVVLNVRDSSEALKGTFTTISGDSGWAYFYSLPAMNPGDIVEAVADGVTTRLVVLPLDITRIDREANLVEGSGPPNSDFALQIRSNIQNNPVYSRSITTAPDGTFSTDLTGSYDLIGGYVAGLVYLDPAANLQGYLANVPYVIGSPSASYVYGYTNHDAPVTVLLKDNGDTLRSSCTTQSSAYGYWSCWFGTVPQVSDRFEITTFGGDFSAVVPALSITADPLTDVVSGSAPVGSTYIYLNGLTDSIGIYLGSSPGGTFNLDLSSFGFDIKHLDSSELQYLTSSGDEFYVDYYVPGVGAGETHNDVFGYAAPDSAVAVELQGSSGLKASANLTAASDGYFSALALCNGAALVDIAPGDTLTAQGYGAVTVPAVTGSLNVATSTLSGTAPPNTALQIIIVNSQWGYIYDASTNASGAYSILSPGMANGSFAEVTWEDVDGDQAQYVFSSTPRAGLGINFTSTPGTARPNAPAFFEWEITGGVNVSTYLRYDTQSHACDRNYRYYAGWSSSSPGMYTGSFLAPAVGPIYVAAYAYIDGHILWSPEIAIPVSDLSPVISDPVNGDTNTATPTLKGFANPALPVSFYEGTPGVGTPTLLGSTAVAPDGSFAYTLPGPLAPGEHSIFASSGALNSNVLHLTIDTSLLVDPNHIFFSENQMSSFRIHDSQGYARLGGNIWLRTNSQLSIRIPIACTPVTAASITVGVETTELIDYGGGTWGADFLHPGSSFAITANITCGANPVQHILLTSGIIDPDGFITNEKTGQAVGGALVILRAYDSSSGQYLDWDAATWGQVNPLTTDADGFYRFFVPPGQYKLQVIKNGYFSFLSDVITVTDAPVHLNVELTPWLDIYIPIVSR